MKDCKNCIHNLPDDVFDNEYSRQFYAKCEKTGEFVEVMRKGGWMMSRITRACGKNPRWFEPIPRRASPELAADINAAVQAGRIVFEPGWDKPREWHERRERKIQQRIVAWLMIAIVVLIAARLAMEVI